MVNIGLRVLYRPDQHDLPTMYRLLGEDYDERVLPSICNEVKTCKSFPFIFQLAAYTRCEVIVDQY